MAMATKRVTLRANYGSHAEVVRVFAYDPWEGKALCLFRYGGGDDSGPWMALSSATASDLEAIHDDPQGTFADVKTELRRRAEFLLPNDR